MKKRKIYLSSLLLLTACGCSGMSNTESGLLGGTAIGTGLGTLVGLATHHPVAGAVAGGLVGGTVGGMAGADQDRRDARNAQYQAAVAAQARNQMSLGEVVQLAQRQVPDSTIIRQMDATNSIFRLTADDIIDLQNHGVSQQVIQAMQARTYPRGAVVMQQPVYVQPVYDPPPVAVGVGFGYGYGRWR